MSYQKNILLLNFIFLSSVHPIFLQKKRKFDENESKSKNEFKPKKIIFDGNNNGINNLNINNKCECNFNYIYSNDNTINNNNSINGINSIDINDSINNMNIDENFINKNYIKINNFNGCKYTLKNITSIINNKETKSSENLSTNKFPIKSKYFNVINIDSTKNKKKIELKNSEKISQNVKNNNEIKVLRNNKVVYINNYLLNSNSTSKNIEPLTKIQFIGGRKRSSRYRGVSKNGNQYQVLAMFNQSKSYIGSYSSEELAAKIYDIISIKNRGIKAKTNFKYSFEQINKIKNADIDIKSEDIDEIIEKLI